MLYREKLSVTGFIAWKYLCSRNLGATESSDKKSFEQVGVDFCTPLAVFPGKPPR